MWTMYKVLFSLLRKGLLLTYTRPQHLLYCLEYTLHTHTLVSTLDRVANNSKKYAIMVKILGHSRVANHSAIGHTVWYCLQISNFIRKSTIPTSYDMHQRHDHHEHTYHCPTLPDTAYDTSYKLLTLWAHSYVSVYV